MQGARRSRSRATSLSQAHCQAIIAQAVSEFGRLDILVNNAAFQATHEDIGEIPADEFEKTLRTNIFAMFYLCQAAIPHLRSGAAIINTHLDPGLPTLAGAAALRHDEGGHHGLYQGAIEDGGVQGHPGQRGGSRPDLDPVDSPRRCRPRR